MNATCLDYRNLYSYYPLFVKQEELFYVVAYDSNIVRGHIRPQAVRADVLAAYKPVFKIAYRFSNLE